MIMNLQLFAHKKGMGSSRNGRDSAAQRLGAVQMAQCHVIETVEGRRRYLVT